MYLGGQRHVDHLAINIGVPEEGVGAEGSVQSYSCLVNEKKEFREKPVILQHCDDCNFSFQQVFIYRPKNSKEKDFRIAERCRGAPSIMCDSYEL